MIDRFVGDYRWLSNFWPVEIEYSGLIYRSVESAYVASKTVDQSIRKHIQELPTSGKAKRFGKSIECRKGWDNMKSGYMFGFLEDKFKPETELAQKLIDTGNRYIIEGNDHGDTFWGVCNGEGKNVLGNHLMKIRDGLI